MSIKDAIHPILSGNSDEGSLSALLRNSHAEFPVSVLLDRESEEITPVKSSHLEKMAAFPTVTRRDILHQAEPEMLSPFTQWLLSLKPSPHSENPVSFPTASDPSLRQGTVERARIWEAGAVKEPKKNKKKKKKKKKDIRKEDRFATDLSSFKDDIISDTLAELIASQGHIDEAINMYRKLVHIHPDKAAHYIQRIHELRPRV